MHKVSIVNFSVLRLLCSLAAVLALSPGVRAQQALTQGIEARVEGRVLLFDGSPAEGVEMVLVTRSASPDGDGKPSLWSGSTKTGSDGTFSLSYSSGGGPDCTLAANLRGYQSLVWEWDEHPRDGVKVLPEQRFSEPCFVTGSIVGADGELLTEGWTVIVRSHPQTLFFHSPTGAGHPLDPSTGQFRVGPVAPGEVEIFAHRDGWGMTQTATVDVRRGEPAHVVLRYTGEDRDKSISITLDSAYWGLEPGAPNLARLFPGAGVELDRPYLFLVDSEGKDLGEATLVPDGVTKQWCFLDVPASEFAIELRHPWFHPVRIDGVFPGKPRTIWAEGNAGIILEVLSSQGTPLTEYELAICYDLGGLGQAVYSLVPSGVPIPRNGHFEHLVPGKAALVVKGGKGEQVTVDLARLEPGETRRVQARLEAVLPMEVQVLDANGEPAQDTVVRIAIGDAAARNSVDRRGRGTPKVVGQTKRGWPEVLYRTDTQGRVTVKAAVAGPWTLRVIASKHVIVTQTVDHPLPDGGPVVLRLPALGRLEGKLRGPVGFDWSMVQLDAMAIPAEVGKATSTWPGGGPDLDATGAFALSGLPLGEVYIVVEFKEFERGGGTRLRPLAHELVEVGAGSQQWELDVAPLLPAKGLVDIAVDGVPGDGLKVALVAEGPTDSSISREGALQLTSIETVTGSDGRAVFAGLNQDQVYTAFVTAANATWVAVAGTLEGQTYSEAGRLDAALETLDRQLLVRRADGTPLAATELAWTCQDKSAKNSRATTSSEGTLTLRMPSGTYSLFRTDRKRPERVPFEWRAGDGPLVIEMSEVE